MAAFVPFAGIAEGLQAQASRDTAPGADDASSQLSAEDQVRLAAAAGRHLSLQSQRGMPGPWQRHRIRLERLWFRAGNAQNALAAYNRAAAAANLVKDAEQGVTALNGLGNVAVKSGQAQEAMQAFQQALEIATAQGVNGGKADALNGLAVLYASQNQPGKALDYANQALAIRREMGDHAGEAAILAEIATGYNAAGNTQGKLSSTHSRRTMLSRRRAIIAARPCR